MKLNWFLRSVLMEEADGGFGDGGGGGDSTALAISTGTSLETPGGGDDGEGAGGDGDGTALATQADSQSVFENGKLSKSATQTFKQLETSNPAARNVLAKAQRALGTVAKLTAMFGAKPFDAINRLRKFERDAGGETGLQALRASVEDMATSDALYEKADPQLLAMMTETPAAKQAFVKLFPHSVAKLREVAPMTYTRFIGREVRAWMETCMVSIKGRNGEVLAQEEIDMSRRMRRIGGSLPWTVDQAGQFTGGTITPLQMQEMQTDLSFIFAYMDKVREYANATPEDLTPPKEDTSAARIADAEQAAEKAVQESWTIQRNAACNDILADEVRKQTKGMELSATIIADITAKSRASINTIRKAQPDNNQKVGAFFKAKNLNGYLAYNLRIFKDNVQSAVEKAVGLYARKSTRRAPAAQPSAAAPVAAGAHPPTPAAQAQAGKVVKINAQQAEQLGGRSSTRWMKQKLGNGPGTTIAMLAQKQHMLRNGNPLGFPEGTIVQFP